MINLFKIFNLQKKLDLLIHQEHKVNYSSIKTELKLALYVELAECANEIRCFKFWSYKKQSNKNIILEEYVDGIHFITSLGIYYKIPSIFKIKKQKKFISKKQITNNFINLFSLIHKINNSKTCYDWYKKYLIFGLKLGFNFLQIINAYEKKCQINHIRQKNKY